MVAIRSNRARVRLGVLALCLASLEGAAGADVTGKLSISGSAGKPPLRGKAFLDRTENPFLGGKPLDPMPYLVVVLEGDGIQLPAAPRVKWRLLGESFDRPVLPVVTGTEIVIENEGRRSPTLYVDGSEDLLPKSPLNPRGERAFKAGTAGSVHVVRDADTPHLRGSVLVLGTPYFASPGKDGKYSIDTAGLADGTYTLRVWYRDGWLEGLDTQVEVSKGKAAKDITLPPGLKPAAAK